MTLSTLTRGTLYNRFLELKRRFVESVLDPAVSRYPVARLTTCARTMWDMFDGHEGK